MYPVAPLVTRASPLLLRSGALGSLGLPFPQRPLYGGDKLLSA